MISQESGIKKKKKQDEAKFNTMIVAIFAFILPFLATTSFYFITEMQFKQLQQDSYYPWPAASVGAYIALVACICQFTGMYCGVTRHKPWWSKKEDTEGEEGEGEQYAVQDLTGAGAAPPPPPPPM